MEKPFRLLLACSLAFAARAAPSDPQPPAPSVQQQQEPKLQEERPGLSDRARVSAEAARKIAADRIPGKIQKQRLEEKDGKLLYEFFIAASPSADPDKLKVDAMTGEVLAVEPDNSFN